MLHPTKRPTKAIPLPPVDAPRFWDRVDQSAGPLFCWPWHGASSNAGYGRIKIDGKLYSPHRIAYVLAKGSIEPDGTYHGPVVMHTCDNAACCNPAHLRLGTQKQNAEDMANKGRCWAQINARALMTISDETVSAIIADPRDSRRAAEAYGVSARYIRQLRVGDTQRTKHLRKRVVTAATSQTKRTAVAHV